MKKIFVLIFLITTALQSAEIIPIWHKESGAGDIHDMEVLPGGDEFLILSGIAEGSKFQVMSVEDGALLREASGYYASFASFELTPDSNRIVVTSGRGGDLELRNLQTFELIKGTFISRPEGFTAYVKNIAIDPNRPYLYVTQYGNNGNSSQFEVKSKVSAYNYETMELVKDLTDYEGYEFSSIAVSDDGKYLATINEGKAYLKVWDLETMELIRNVQLYDDKLPNTDWWCDSKDIQFSKLNSDVIYYSGLFTKQINKKRQNGVFNFSISSNVQSRIVEDGLYDGGKIILLDNENRIFISTPSRIYILNLEMNELEFKYILNGNIHAGEKVIYSKEDNSFIGYSNYFLDKFLYDRQTLIDSEFEENIIISPNPTSSIVNLSLDCSDEKSSYTITNQSGQVVAEKAIPISSNSLQIDFSPFPPGVYFLTTRCGGELKTYKVVREG